MKVILCPDWKLYSYGIDYLTATTPVENVEAFDIAIAAYCQQENVNKLTDGKEAKQRDFVGTKWGKCFVGKNKTHAIINISSFVSWDLFLTVAKRIEVKITRIDLQMTGYSDEQRSRLGRNVRDMLLDAQSEKKIDSRLKIDSRDNGNKTNTVYVGSENSHKRLRLYNKTVQAKLDTGDTTLWRWELQLRQELAHHCAMHLAANQDDPRNVTRYLLGYLWSWNMIVSEGLESIPLKYSEVAKEDDLMKKYNWVITQVLPTIDTLLASEAYGDVMERVLLLALKKQSMERDAWHRLLKE